MSAILKKSANGTECQRKVKQQMQTKQIRWEKKNKPNQQQCIIFRDSHQKLKKYYLQSNNLQKKRKPTHLITAEENTRKQETRRNKIRRKSPKKIVK